MYNSSLQFSVKEMADANITTIAVNKPKKQKKRIVDDALIVEVELNSQNYR
jgi:hypothetical protein